MRHGNWANLSSIRWQSMMPIRGFNLHACEVCRDLYRTSTTSQVNIIFKIKIIVERLLTFFVCLHRRDYGAGYLHALRPWELTQDRQTLRGEICRPIPMQPPGGAFAPLP